MKKLGFKHTFISCYIGVFVQSIVCGFTPLLFITFNREFGIPLSQITLLVTVNFLAQLATDTVSIFVIDKVGYRRACMTAYFLATAGFLGIGVVAPNVENVYLGLLASTVLFSVGGGLLEVILSPIVEGCPSENKAAAMSALHSMYGFGSAAVIIITTAILFFCGRDSWRLIAVFWAIFPFLNLIYCIFIPINDATCAKEKMSIRAMVSDKKFWGFALVMMCGGASEIGISQWASAFAESSLGISKTAGDILGPCAFAVMMALSRITYSRLADRIDLSKCIIVCGIFAVICYLVAALSPVPIIALIACGLCGFVVGILWPGTLSLSAAAYPAGGAALFAVMALSGDVGCTLGPSVVGFVASLFGGELKTGLLAGAFFPCLLVVGLKLLNRKKAK